MIRASRPSALWLVIAACTVEDEVAPGPTAREPVADAGPDLVAEVGAPTKLDGGGSLHVVSARWTFGDGVGSEPSDEPSTSYVWTRPGHYVATLEVTGEDGRTATDAARVTVIWPPLNLPPQASSTITGDGANVWIAMPDFGLVANLDPAQRAVRRHLPTCARPRRVAVFEPDPTGAGRRLAVACDERDPAVALYDTASAPSEIAMYRPAVAGWSPSAVGFTGRGDVLFAARERASTDGILGALDASGAPAYDWRVGTDLRTFSVVGEEVWTTRHRSPVDGGQLWSFGLRDEQLRAFTVAPAPGPDSDTNARGVPNYLSATAVRPDGRAIAIGGLKSNVFRGVYRDGQPLTDETTVRADLRLLAISPSEGELGSELASARLDNRDRVASLAWHPRGDWLYVGMHGASVIDVLDGYTLERAATVQGVGLDPEGMWITPDGSALWVDLPLLREVVVFDLTDPTAPIEVARLSTLPETGEVVDPLVLEGQRIFNDASDIRMSFDGYISCASCHLDGEDDGQVWDFTQRGEGLRSTISLRGMADRLDGPIHWSANFDEIQDFEADIRNGQGGRGFLPENLWRTGVGPALGAPKAGLSPELDALAAYVASLGAIDVPAPEATVGEAVFVRLGCAGCHPDGGTDSRWIAEGEPLLHDVGTLTDASGQRMGGPLTGLDTPDLRGCWSTPPYLHDGSARSLRAVFTQANPGGRHADLLGVPEADIDALLVYLTTL